MEVVDEVVREAPWRQVFVNVAADGGCESGLVFGNEHDMEVVRLGTVANDRVHSEALDQLLVAAQAYHSHPSAVVHEHLALRAAQDRRAHDGDRVAALFEEHSRPRFDHLAKVRDLLVIELNFSVRKELICVD